MKILLPLLVLLPLAAGAQTPPPKPPLLHRAPALASWTISYAYKDEEGRKAEGATAPERIRSVSVTKSNAVYAARIQLASGKEYEHWSIDGVELRTLPDGPSVLLVPPPTPDSPEPDYIDYRAEDFEGFRWISLANYKGISSFQGQEAYRFEAEGRTALLAVETQLPLFLGDAEGSRTYVPHAPPREPLVPPKRFLDVIQTQKRGEEQHKFRAAPM